MVKAKTAPKKTTHKAAEQKAPVKKETVAKTDNAEIDQKGKVSARDDGGNGPINEGQFPGEHIIQHKPALGDAIKGAGTFDSIGKGSVTEEAPAVRGIETSEVKDRIVQQGDEVLVHVKNPIDGKMELTGRVLKVNPNGTLAVRLDRGGTYQDMTSIYNAPTEGGDPWFSWPAKAA